MSEQDGGWCDEWNLRDEDRCEVPAGFALHAWENALHFDEGPIVLFAEGDGGPWIATRADDGDVDSRWTCAAITDAERVEIVKHLDNARRRELWERAPVLVVECEEIAGRATKAWRVSAASVKGLCPTFLDEDVKR